MVSKTNTGPNTDEKVLKCVKDKGLPSEKNVKCDKMKKIVFGNSMYKKIYETSP